MLQRDSSNAIATKAIGSPTSPITYTYVCEQCKSELTTTDRHERRCPFCLCKMDEYKESGIDIRDIDDCGNLYGDKLLREAMIKTISPGFPYKE